ncbi:MAG: hypothetical protein QOJ02_3138 [Acidobacteriota bacterium]|nr:hypothetical protein [Acidobacteriota bacterium]
MRIRTSIHTCLAIILFLSAFATSSAQEDKTGKIVVSMKDTYYISFSTTPDANAPNASGWKTNLAEAYFESNTIRRVLVDSGGTLFFGYVLVVEPILSTKQFKVSVRPLSPEDQQELLARKSFSTRRIHPNYNVAGLSRSSAPQIINDGDTFALDVLVNPQTGDKITDIVTVSSDQARLREAPANEIPRDFTLEDVAMKMINYQLLVNGELVAGGKRSGACAGPLIWFHLPERGGRFIFSLMPHAGYDFQKIGTIENNRIKFKLDGANYEWVSNTPVVGTGGNWNLYVLYDPGYIPDPFLLGVNGAAKPEKRDASSRLNELERNMRRTKTVGATGFEKTPDSRKDEDEGESSAARLIIGASDSIENLLPKK